MSRRSDSAFAVIVSGRPRVLVVQKSNGAWGLPGGGIERGETPRTAVIREIREETGLQARGAEHVATLSRSGRRVHVFVLEKKRTKGKLVGRTDEIRRQRWIAPRAALSLLTDRNATRLEKALPHALRLVGDN